MSTINLLIHNFLILFAMVNAIGNLPLFADLTAQMEKKEKSRSFLVAVLTGGSIVLIFALFGDFMLRNVFVVSTSAFKIAGGLLVFAVAAKGVLSGQVSGEVQNRPSSDVAVFPMGFPFLAGPGTILTTILLLQANGYIITVSTILLVYAAILPLLYLAPWVEKIIGKIGVMVIARILYIFICAKGVSFVLDGFHVKI
ncbi:MAG TPA: MarC family protein [Bacteroidales bacterium]|nr:MarC family protein [Bacteroidales bacterium]HPT02300.1 MarC family protein [Bacteroidales bacterium]